MYGNGIEPVSASGGGFIKNMTKSTLALGLLILGIILLVVGLYLISDDNTSSGYPVLIAGVLTGGVGGFLIHRKMSESDNEDSDEKEASKEE